MSDPAHTILVVDDEQEILDSLRRTLRGEPYRILLTTSPREAIAMIDAGGVDLLLSDIDMPEMNGIELVAHVRRTHPEVVRLLLTGDASLESALEAINGGEVHRYLLKPWEKASLRDTIRGALERLEELRRAATADSRASLRERVLSELEREHPGIRRGAPDDGVVVLDGARVDALVAELAPAERVLFQAREPRPFDPANDDTVDSGER